MLLARQLKVNVYYIKKENRAMVRLRMLFAVFSASFAFYSFQKNTLAIATTLLYTAHIFTSIFGKIFLNENISKWDYAKMVSTVAGVMFIYSPWHWNPPNTTIIGITLGLTAAIFQSASLITTSKVSTEIHPFVSVFYFCVATSLSSSIGYYTEVLVGSNHVSWDLWSCIWICVMVLTGFIAMVMFSSASKLEKVGKLTGMRFLMVFLAFVVDLFIFGEKYNYNEMIGAIMIVIFHFLIFIIRMAKGK